MLLRIAGVIALVAALAAPANAQVFDWLGRIELDAQGLDSSDPKTRAEAVTKLGRYSIEWTKPYLLKAVKDDSDIDVRSAAGRLLGKNKVAEAVPIVIKWLVSADKRTKKDGVDILGQLGSKSAVTALVRSLGDLDHEVRLSAVNALGAIGGGEAVVPLIGRLDDDKADVRQAAVKALMDLGDKRAVIPLVGIFNDSTLTVRESAITAVGRLGDRAAVPALLRLLKDPADNIKIAAVTSLGSLHATDAVDELVAALESGSPSLKAKAAVSLGQIARAPDTDKKIARLAMRALVKQLSDGSLKGPAKEALLLAGPVAVPSLVAHLEGKLEGDPTTAVMLLRDIGDPRATEVLITELDRGRINRELVLSALSRAGDQRALVPVLDLLSDPDASVRLHAMRALQPMLTHDSMAADVLVDRLSDRNIEVRVLAAQYLGLMGAKVAVPELSNLAEASQKNRLRAAAIEALGDIKDKRATKVLIKILREGPSSLRIPAANALIYIRDDDSIKPLLELARSSSTVSRQAVVRALGGVLRDRKHDEARKILEKMADRDKVPVSLAAIAALSAMANKESVVLLQRLVEERNPDRKRAAIEALGNLGDRSAVVLLRSQLSSSDDRIVAAAAWSLAKLGPGDKLGPIYRASKRRGFATPINASAVLALHARKTDAKKIRALLHHRSRFVRVNAAYACGRLELKSARSALIDILERDPSWMARVAAARALSRIGGAKAQLTKAASDDSKAVRAAARVALKKPFSPPERVEFRNFYFVDPGSGDAPVKQEAYFLSGSDGLVTAFYTDARGEAAEERFPPGDHIINSAQREKEH